MPQRQKQGAAPTFKGGFGYTTLTAWCDNTGESLALMLRPGNAGANTTADHIAVTDRAGAQIPDAHRYGTPLLVCADGAGTTKAWLAHLRRLRDKHGLDLRFFGRGSPPSRGYAHCHYPPADRAAGVGAVAHRRVDGVPRPRRRRGVQRPPRLAGQHPGLGDADAAIGTFEQRQITIDGYRLPATG